MQYSLLRSSVAEIQHRMDLGTACSLLESECRRRILRVLENTSGTTTRTELGRALARDDGQARSSGQVEIRLYHVHLPMLADANAIRYDAERETVAITEAGERVLQCLDAMEREFAGRE